MVTRPEGTGRANEVEVANPPMDEIIFYGDMTWLLKNDIKIVTVRKPNSKYDFQPGAVVKARCKYEDNEGVLQEDEVELVVMANETRSLRDFSPLVLFLDGFISPEDAALKLGEYYEGVTPDTKMQAICTMTTARFDSLSKAERQELLGKGFAVLAEPEQPYKTITWRALCFWYLDQHYGIYDENDCWTAWVRYLVENKQFGLGYTQELVGTDWVVNDITKDEPKVSVQRLLDIVLGDPESALFYKYVLLEP